MKIPPPLLAALAIATVLTPPVRAQNPTDATQTYSQQQSASDSAKSARDAAARSVANSWAQTDPQAALAWAQSLQPGWNDPTKLNLTITGGNIVEDGKTVGPATVGTVLDYLGKKDARFSYILTPGVANLEVADMVLHGVRVTDFSRALVQATDSQLTANFDRGSPTPILQISGPSTKLSVEAFNLRDYLSSSAASDPFQAAATPGNATASGNVASPDAMKKLRSVRALITQTVSDMDDKQGTLSKGLRFEFHEGSGVLVVIGQARAIEAAEQVIGALQPAPSATAEQNNPIGFIIKKWAQSGPADGSRRSSDLSAFDKLAQKDPAAVAQMLAGSSAGATFPSAQAEMSQDYADQLQQQQEAQKEVEALVQQMNAYRAQLNALMKGLNTAAAPGAAAPATSPQPTVNDNPFNSGASPAPSPTPGSR